MPPAALGRVVADRLVADGFLSRWERVHGDKGSPKSGFRFTKAGRLAYYCVAPKSLLFALLLALAATLTLATVPARAAQATSATDDASANATTQREEVMPAATEEATQAGTSPTGRTGAPANAAGVGDDAPASAPDPAPADAPADDLSAWVQAAGWCPVRTRASGEADSGEGDGPLGCDAGLALRLAPRLYFGHLTPIAAVGASSVGVGAAWLLTRRLGVGVAVVAPYSTSGGVRANESVVAVGATLSVRGGGQ